MYKLLSRSVTKSHSTTINFTNICKNVSKTYNNNSFTTLKRSLSEPSIKSDLGLDEQTVDDNNIDTNPEDLPETSRSPFCSEKYQLIKQAIFNDKSKDPVHVRRFHTASSKYLFSSNINHNKKHSKQSNTNIRNVEIYKKAMDQCMKIKLQKKRSDNPFLDVNLQLKPIKQAVPLTENEINIGKIETDVKRPKRVLNTKDLPNELQRYKKSVKIEHPKLKEPFRVVYPIRNVKERTTFYALRKKATGGVVQQQLKKLHPLGDPSPKNLLQRYVTKPPDDIIEHDKLQTFLVKQGIAIVQEPPSTVKTTPGKTTIQKPPVKLTDAQKNEYGIFPSLTKTPQDKSLRKNESYKSGVLKTVITDRSSTKNLKLEMENYEQKRIQKNIQRLLKKSQEQANVPLDSPSNETKKYIKKLNTLKQQTLLDRSSIIKDSKIEKAFKTGEDVETKVHFRYEQKNSDKTPMVGKLLQKIPDDDKSSKEPNVNQKLSKTERSSLSVNRRTKNNKLTKNTDTLQKTLRKYKYDESEIVDDGTIPSNLQKSHFNNKFKNLPALAMEPVSKYIRKIIETNKNKLDTHGKITVRVSTKHLVKRIKQSTQNIIPNLTVENQKKEETENLQTSKVTEQNSSQQSETSTKNKPTDTKLYTMSNTKTDDKIKTSLKDHEEFIPLKRFIKDCSLENNKDDINEIIQSEILGKEYPTTNINEVIETLKETPSINAKVINNERLRKEINEQTLPQQQLNPSKDNKKVLINAENELGNKPDLEINTILNKQTQNTFKKAYLSSRDTVESCYKFAKEFVQEQDQGASQQNVKERTIVTRLSTEDNLPNTTNKLTTSVGSKDVIKTKLDTNEELKNWSKQSNSENILEPLKTNNNIDEIKTKLNNATSSNDKTEVIKAVDRKRRILLKKTQDLTKAVRSKPLMKQLLLEKSSKYQKQTNKNEEIQQNDQLNTSEQQSTVDNTETVLINASLSSRINSKVQRIPIKFYKPVKKTRNENKLEKHILQLQKIANNKNNVKLKDPKLSSTIVNQSKPDDGLKTLSGSISAGDFFQLKDTPQTSVRSTERNVKLVKILKNKKKINNQNANKYSYLKTYTDRKDQNNKKIIKKPYILSKKLKQYENIKTDLNITTHARLKETMKKLNRPQTNIREKEGQNKTSSSENMNYNSATKLIKEETNKPISKIDMQLKNENTIPSLNTENKNYSELTVRSFKDRYKKVKEETINTESKSSSALRDSENNTNVNKQLTNPTYSNFSETNDIATKNIGQNNERPVKLSKYLNTFNKGNKQGGNVGIVSAIDNLQDGSRNKENIETNTFNKRKYLPIKHKDIGDSKISSDQNNYKIVNNPNNYYQHLKEKEFIDKSITFKYNNSFFNPKKTGQNLDTSVTAANSTKISEGEKITATLIKVLKKLQIPDKDFKEHDKILDNMVKTNVGRYEFNTLNKDVKYLSEAGKKDKTDIKNKSKLSTVPTYSGKASFDKIQSEVTLKHSSNITEDNHFKGASTNYLKLWRKVPKQAPRIIINKYRLNKTKDASPTKEAPSNNSEIKLDDMDRFYRLKEVVKKAKDRLQNNYNSQYVPQKNVNSSPGSHNQFPKFPNVKRLKPNIKPTSKSPITYRMKAKNLEDEGRLNTLKNTTKVIDRKTVKEIPSNENKSDISAERPFIRKDIPPPPPKKDDKSKRDPPKNRPPTIILPPPSNQDKSKLDDDALKPKEVDVKSNPENNKDKTDLRELISMEVDDKMKKNLKYIVAFIEELKSKYAKISELTFKQQEEELLKMKQKQKLLDLSLQDKLPITFYNPTSSGIGSSMKLERFKQISGPPNSMEIQVQKPTPKKQPLPIHIVRKLMQLKRQRDKSGSYDRSAEYERFFDVVTRPQEASISKPYLKKHYSDPNLLKINSVDDDPTKEIFISNQTSASIQRSDHLNYIPKYGGNDENNSKNKFPVGTIKNNNLHKLDANASVARKKEITNNKTERIKSNSEVALVGTKELPAKSNETLSVNIKKSTDSSKKLTIDVSDLRKKKSLLLIFNTDMPEDSKSVVKTTVSMGEIRNPQVLPENSAKGSCVLTEQLSEHTEGIINKNFPKTVSVPLNRELFKRICEDNAKKTRNSKATKETEQNETKETTISKKQTKTTPTSPTTSENNKRNNRKFITNEQDNQSFKDKPEFLIQKSNLPLYEPKRLNNLTESMLNKNKNLIVTHNNQSSKEKYNKAEKLIKEFENRELSANTLNKNKIGKLEKCFSNVVNNLKELDKKDKLVKTAASDVNNMVNKCTKSFIKELFEKETSNTIKLHNMKSDMVRNNKTTTKTSENNVNSSIDLLISIKKSLKADKLLTKSEGKEFITFKSSSGNSKLKDSKKYIPKNLKGDEAKVVGVLENEKTKGDVKEVSEANKTENNLLAKNTNINANQQTKSLAQNVSNMINVKKLKNSLTNINNNVLTKTNQKNIPTTKLTNETPTPNKYSNIEDCLLVHKDLTKNLTQNPAAKIEKTTIEKDNKILKNNDLKLKDTIENKEGDNSHKTQTSVKTINKEIKSANDILNKSDIEVISSQKITTESTNKKDLELINNNLNKDANITRPVIKTNKPSRIVNKILKKKLSGDKNLKGTIKIIKTTKTKNPSTEIIKKPKDNNQQTNKMLTAIQSDEVTIIKPSITKPAQFKKHLKINELGKNNKKYNKTLNKPGTKIVSGLDKITIAKQSSNNDIKKTTSAKLVDEAVKKPTTPNDNNGLIKTKSTGSLDKIHKKELVDEAVNISTKPNDNIHLNKTKSTKSLNKIHKKGHVDEAVKKSTKPNDNKCLVTTTSTKRLDKIVKKELFDEAVKKSIKPNDNIDLKKIRSTKSLDEIGKDEFVDEAVKKLTKPNDSKDLKKAKSATSLDEIDKKELDHVAVKKTNKDIKKAKLIKSLDKIDKNELVDKSIKTPTKRNNNKDLKKTKSTKSLDRRDKKELSDEAVKMSPRPNDNIDLKKTKSTKSLDKIHKKELVDEAVNKLNDSKELKKVKSAKSLDEINKKELVNKDVKKSTTPNYNTDIKKGKSTRSLDEIDKKALVNEAAKKSTTSNNNTGLIKAKSAKSLDKLNNNVHVNDCIKTQTKSNDNKDLKQTKPTNSLDKLNKKELVDEDVKITTKPNDLKQAKSTESLDKIHTKEEQRKDTIVENVMTNNITNKELKTNSIKNYKISSLPNNKSKPLDISSSQSFNDTERTGICKPRQVLEAANKKQTDLKNTQPPKNINNKSKSNVIKTVKQNNVIIANKSFNKDLKNTEYSENIGNINTLLNIALNKNKSTPDKAINLNENKTTNESSNKNFKKIESTENINKLNKLLETSVKNNETIVDKQGKTYIINKPTKTDKIDMKENIDRVNENKSIIIRNDSTKVDSFFNKDVKKTESTSSMDKSIKMKKLPISVITKSTDKDSTNTEHSQDIEKPKTILNIILKKTKSTSVKSAKQNNVMLTSKSINKDLNKTQTSETVSKIINKADAVIPNKAIIQKETFIHIKKIENSSINNNLKKDSATDIQLNPERRNLNKDIKKIKSIENINKNKTSNVKKTIKQVPEESNVKKDTQILVKDSNIVKAKSLETPQSKYDADLFESSFVNSSNKKSSLQNVVLSNKKIDEKETVEETKKTDKNIKSSTVHQKDTTEENKNVDENIKSSPTNDKTAPKVKATKKPSSQNIDQNSDTSITEDGIVKIIVETKATKIVIDTKNDANKKSLNNLKPPSGLQVAIKQTKTEKEERLIKKSVKSLENQSIEPNDKKKIQELSKKTESSNKELNNSKTISTKKDTGNKITKASTTSKTNNFLKKQQSDKFGTCAGCQISDNKNSDNKVQNRDSLQNIKNRIATPITTPTNKRKSHLDSLEFKPVKESDKLFKKSSSNKLESKKQLKSLEELHNDDRSKCFAEYDNSYARKRAEKLEDKLGDPLDCFKAYFDSVEKRIKKIPDPSIKFPEKNNSKQNVVCSTDTKSLCAVPDCNLNCCVSYSTTTAIDSQDNSSKSDMENSIKPLSRLNLKQIPQELYMCNKGGDKPDKPSNNKQSKDDDNKSKKSDNAPKKAVFRIVRAPNFYKGGRRLSKSTKSSRKLSKLSKQKKQKIAKKLGQTKYHGRRNVILYILQNHLNNKLNKTNLMAESKILTAKEKIDKAVEKFKIDVSNNNDTDFHTVSVVDTELNKRRRSKDLMYQRFNKKISDILNSSKTAKGSKSDDALVKRTKSGETNYHQMIKETSDNFEYTHTNLLDSKATRKFLVIDETTDSYDNPPSTDFGKYCSTSKYLLENTLRKPPTVFQHALKQKLSKDVKKREKTTKAEKSDKSNPPKASFTDLLDSRIKEFKNTVRDELSNIFGNPPFYYEQPSKIVAKVEEIVDNNKILKNFNKKLFTKSKKEENVEIYSQPRMTVSSPDIIQSKVTIEKDLGVFAKPEQQEIFQNVRKECEQLVLPSKSLLQVVEALPKEDDTTLTKRTEEKMMSIRKTGFEKYPGLKITYVAVNKGDTVPSTESFGSPKIKKATLTGIEKQTVATIRSEFLKRMEEEFENFNRKHLNSKKLNLKNHKLKEGKSSSYVIGEVNSEKSNNESLMNNKIVSECNLNLNPHHKPKNNLEVILKQWVERNSQHNDSDKKDPKIK